MIVSFIRILHKEFSIFFSEQCEKSLVCSKVLYISMLEIPLLVKIVIQCCNWCYIPSAAPLLFLTMMINFNLYDVSFQNDDLFYRIQIKPNLIFPVILINLFLCNKKYFLIDKLLRLIMTLSVSTTTTERSFSAMKIIKSKLRNKMDLGF